MTLRTAADSMVSRANARRSRDWWWTVDRLLLAAIGGADAGRHRAVACGEPAGRGRASASSRSTSSTGTSLYLVPAIAVLLARLVPVAAPDPPARARRVRRQRRMLAATLLFGAEVKGARRWLVLAGVNIQPSEFLKPAFVILIAWLFAESRASVRKCRRTPWRSALLLLVVALLRAAARLRPDHADRCWSGARCSSWPACG